VQEAILRNECGKWTPSDRGLIFTTAQAYGGNWLDNGQMDRETGDPLPRTGLKRCIDRIGLPFSVERLGIPDGKSESEIWRIFSIVFESLADKEKMSGFDDFDMLPPFRPLFDRVKAKLGPFGKNTLSDGIAAARWCFDHNLIQQAYTILVELLISHFVLKGSGDVNDPGERGIVSGAPAIAAESIPRKDWYQNSLDNMEKTLKYLETCRSEMELVKTWQVLVDYRNDINHAAFQKDYKSAGAFKRKMVQLIARFEEYNQKGK